MAEPKATETDPVFTDWYNNQFLKQFHDVGKRIALEQQKEFIHGGEWNTDIQQDHSLAYAIKLLSAERREPLAAATSTKWFGLFAQPQGQKEIPTEKPTKKLGG